MAAKEARADGATQRPLQRFPRSLSKEDALGKRDGQPMGCRRHRGNQAGAWNYLLFR